MKLIAIILGIFALNVNNFIHEPEQAQITLLDQENHQVQLYVNKLKKEFITKCQALCKQKNGVNCNKKSSICCTSSQDCLKSSNGPYCKRTKILTKKERDVFDLRQKNALKQAQSKYQNNQKNQL